MRPRHVYVHAPFCARRCSYCDFAVTVRADPPVRAWADTLARELDRLARSLGWTDRLALDTLYLGGGTPSLLGEGAVGRLLAALETHADPGSLVEFTAEANPESFTAALAADWRREGVDRVSLGAQTFHGPSLRWMGRLHGPEGPDRAIRNAREAGIAAVGIDLIFGLPERLGRDLDHDLDRALGLEPDHVSLYGLTVEPDTPLGRWVAEGRESVAGEDRYREEYLRVAERLTSTGYEHYEVSNFARPGHRARHNAAYWNGSPYLGLGNGAHSYLPPERWWNHRDWATYRRAVVEGRGGRAGAEGIGPDSARLERTWLGLRTTEGLPAEGLGPAQTRLVEDWRRRGWARPDPDAVRLTPEGWLLLDRLAVELDSRRAAGASSRGRQRA